MASDIKERGFTVMEGVIVVLIVGAVVAFSVPQVVRAVREHRISVAVREVGDLIQRAKTQAMADNRTSSIVVDTAASRIGFVVYDEAGVVVRTDYNSLPEGVTFDKPADAPAPMDGAPSSSAVSFPSQEGSTTIFQQDFNPRGFPVVVTPGDVNAVYLGNGRSFRAITMTSVGGIRIWWWEEDRWVAASKQ